MLLDLLSDVSSWSELEARISALSEEHERGAAFEEFCSAYFALSDLFQFKAVYRHDKIQPSLCRQLGYPEGKDIGIDGLGITQDEKLYAWQAKFRQDRSRTPSKRELSTFFTFSDKADWRITITNANTIPHELNDRNRQSKIFSDRLDALDVEFFDNLRAYLSNNTKKRKEPESPHSTQGEMVKTQKGSQCR